MSNSNSQSDALKKATGLLSAIVGILATFLFAPQFYHASVDWVLAYASSQYGSGWDPLIQFFWAIICGLAAFGIFSIIVTMAVRLGLARLAALSLNR
ncbi:MAG: hypothetical protein AAFP79_12275 [Pseudomonadota bacterium]